MIDRAPSSGYDTFRAFPRYLGTAIRTRRGWKKVNRGCDAAEVVAMMSEVNLFPAAFRTGRALALAGGAALHLAEVRFGT